MRTTRTSRPPSSSAPLLVVLAVLTALLAACGGGGSGGDDVATLGASSSEDRDDAAGGDGEVSDADREDAMLEFAECMREHGVDMPDPTFDGGGMGGRIEVGVSGGAGTDMEEMQAAQEACDHLLEGAMGERPQLSPEEEAEMRDRMLAYTECMREHGVDMPDPEFDGSGGVMIGPGPGGGGPDFDDEEFQAAEDACRSELGVEDGRGPGGGPGMVFESSSSAVGSES